MGLPTTRQAMQCASELHKATTESWPVTVYAVIAHCLSTLHNETREVFTNKKHKRKVQNAAHSLSEHYTYNSLCTYLSMYTKALMRSAFIKLMTSTADPKYAVCNSLYQHWTELYCVLVCTIHMPV